MTPQDHKSAFAPSYPLSLSTYEDFNKIKNPIAKTGEAKRDEENIKKHTSGAT